MLPLRCLTVLLAMSANLAGQGGNFFATAQETDGHWSAERFGGRPEADLRVSAWMMLALLGDGSTTRVGPNRLQLRRGIRWLAAQQDADGRFALRADPDWVRDHAMASYALAEEARLGERRLLLPRLLRAMTALQARVREDRPVVGPEVRLWSVMVARSVGVTAAAVDAKVRETVVVKEQLAAASEALLMAVAQLPGAEPSTAREHAAIQLLASLQNEAGSVLEALPERWPENVLLDPMTTFYLSATRYRSGGQGWRLTQTRLNRLVKAQLPAGHDLGGSWNPTGSFGDENGRVGATAAAVLTLEIFYRYCKLQMFD